MAFAREAVGQSPCHGVTAEVWEFVEVFSERLLWEGRLFGDDGESAVQRDGMLEDLDAAFEACVPALLLALLSRAAEMLARRDFEQGMWWHDAFQLWGSLRWSRSLAWQNMQDPLVQQALQVGSLQINVLHGLASRPADVCFKFTSALTQLMEDAAGLSMTVSRHGSENLQTFPSVAKTAMAIASQSFLLDEVSGCHAARLLAHLFTARRLLDIKPWLASGHVRAIKALRAELLSGGVELEWHPLSGLIQTLEFGLLLQQKWMWEAGWLAGTYRGTEVANRSSPEPPMPAGGVDLGVLSIWERNPAPVFSEGTKDSVLERIFGLIGVTNRFFVEVGTQMGDQCNSRYLRVRYGFEGLLLDDNFQNVQVNQRRHRVTPDNIAELFVRYDVPRQFDMLSLDTDGNEWLLWRSLQEAGFSPRIVVIEFSPLLPFRQDVLVRHTHFPLHRMCLASMQRLPWLAGGSVTGILEMGRRWGYSLVHLVAGGTTDLIFIRRDALDEKRIVFPAQDDPAGLCSLARFQSPGSGLGVCAEDWPEGKLRPHDDLLTTSSAALMGDYTMPGGWDAAGLRDAFC